MGCEVGDLCLELHIRPRLKDPKPAGPFSYRALAPCHPDITASMTVSWLDGRIVWNCFACKKMLGNDMAQKVTRNALIARNRIPARCLPQAKDDAEAQLESIREILDSDGKPAQRLFRIAAILGGWADTLPAGEELEYVADSCHVSHSTGYDTRRASHDR